MAVDDLWTTADIARRLSISAPRARGLCDRDDFPMPIHSVGHFVLWRARDVEAWLAQGRPDL
ncbi:helix-turn-helix domain-containing protein [Candidatus Frankia alpina]|uniref:Helix-turn-helix domain-containing protein n=1 Tax=Candidatus Frankia alpina TaxID=2699483 RepID=A0A4S5ECN4_9ACTN|nr:helix-turn-helix domain-containing protein [Candidatus Frankia alpina]